MRTTEGGREGGRDTDLLKKKCPLQDEIRPRTPGEVIEANGRLRAGSRQGQPAERCNSGGAGKKRIIEPGCWSVRGLFVPSDKKYECDLQVYGLNVHRGARSALSADIGEKKKANQTWN